MFAHVQIGANDIIRMVAFYDEVLAVLRIPRTGFSEEAGHVWSKNARWPQFVVRKPFDGLAATAGNGVQVSFLTDDRETVALAWHTALDNGGEDEGRPGLRPRYSADFFAAYCRDPEGNKLCFVHTTSQS